MRKHGMSLRMGLGVCALTGLWLGLMPLDAEAQLQTEQQQQQQVVIQFVRDPDPAPDLKAKDLDGKELSLDAYKGKVVLLNFWATWCGPCRAEIPSLIRIQEAYKDRLQIIGMDVDDDDEGRLRAFVKNEGINYPVAMTSDAVRLAYGGIAALPTVFVINRDSKVVQKHVGLFNPALYEIEARALLDMPVPARVETFQDTGEVFLKHADRATMLPGVDTLEIDGGTAHGGVAQAQRGKLRLRLQVHAGAMPHLRSRVQNQQGTRRSHRDGSWENAAPGWTGEYCCTGGTIRARDPAKRRGRK